MSREDIELLDPASRQEIYRTKVAGAIKDALTIKTPKVQVDVLDVRIDDKKADADAVNPTALREIKLKDGTLASRIIADMKVTHDGKTHTLKGVTVGQLPTLTTHRTFLVGGSEYAMPLQARLRPGVYTRVKENGIVESHFNFAKTSTTRIPFRIELEPETGTFKAKVAQGTVPLYPLMLAMGISDSQIAKVWGGDVLKANQGSTSPAAAAIKFMEIVKGQKGGVTERDALDGMKEYMSGAHLDPNVTQITLGNSYETVTPSSILEATRRILAVNKGHEKQDDRDSIVFKSVHTYDDFVAEAVTKAKRGIQIKLARNIAKHGPTAGAIPKDDIVRAVMHPFVGGSGLSSYVDQYNPYQVLGETQTISVMGEGGLGSVNAATMEARAVHPSSVGVIDPIGTPQSEKVGLKQKVAVGAVRKGDSLATKVYNLKTKKEEYKTPTELYQAYVAFPEQFDTGTKKFKGDKIRGVHAGTIGVFPKDKIEYVYSEWQGLFSFHTLSVPFMSSNQGNRMLMSDNMLDQVVPVSDPDIPNVMPHGGLVSRAVASTFDHTAEADGTVSKVTKGEIIVKGKDGENRYPLYNGYPLNHSYIDSTTTLKPGDKVKAGQVLTQSTFTKDGHVAIGKNLNVAFMPYKGYNHEDAIVISESAAKKMSSNHMYKYELKEDNNGVVNKQKFAATFPSLMTRENLDKLDSTGIIKEGATVNPGEIVMAYMVKRQIGEDVAALGRIHKAFMRPWKSMAVYYDGPVVGKVRDVSSFSGNHKVFIQTTEVSEVGDKLVNFHAAKGIIGKILPDSEMPHSKDGKPVEVLLNTAGIIGRVNPGQVLEMAAGKVAAKTGKTFFTNDFSQAVNNMDQVMAEMKKHGIKDKEELVDPTTGKSFGDIAVGPMHMFKLKHRAYDKLSARSRGGYDVDMKPSRGGDEGAKRLDPMTYNALLAHGAKNVLQEASTWKGGRDDDFWNALQTGRPLPAPKTPFAFEKMVGMMKGAGINVTEKGDMLKLSPLTDAQIKDMSGGEISEPSAVRAKNFSEVNGGLFDKKITGGLSGKSFAHIKLTEPVLNPVFAKTVSKILGKPLTEIERIASGAQEVEVGGKKLTAGMAIKAMLGELDVDALMRKTKKDASVLKGAKLTDANFVIHTLQNLKELGDRPEEAFVLHNIPVIPPAFRPIYPMNNGQLRVSPINYHYQDIMLFNKSLSEGKKLPDELKREARKDMYNSVKATVGLSAPLPSTVYRAGTDNLPGLLETIRGDTSAKEGYFQDKVWGKSQDLSGRSVIAPGPELGMDEAGIPLSMAWTQYRPFIIKELVRMGRSLMDAQREVDKQTPMARAALDKVVTQRPLIINRAPVLHKYGVLAFKPKLTNENVIRMPPYVLEGYGGDYDGDTMQTFVPISDKAVEEAMKMLPSNNAVHPSTGRPTMLPQKDTLYGIYNMSRTVGKANKSFKTMEEAETAVRHGVVKVNDVVSIGGKKITPGQAALAKLIPNHLYRPGDVLDKKKIEHIARTLSGENKSIYATVMNKLKDMADEHSHSFSIGISDLHYPGAQRQALLGKHKRAVEGADSSTLGGKVMAATKELEEDAMAFVKKKDSPLYHGIISGAGGTMGDVKQLVTTPVTVGDHRDRPLPTVFGRSYAEGLGLSDYWMASYGARRGVVGRSLMTFEPGTVSKRTMSTMADMVVTVSDCGTKHGIDIDVESHDALDRYLAAPAGGFKYNELVTPRVISDLKKKRIKSISVRSPITCEAVHGVCAHCAGVNENGQAPSVGSNIGVEHGQYLTEPLFSASMKSFHTGNVVKMKDNKSMTDFQAVRQLLEMKETVRGKAAIASKAGKVNSIYAAPAGGTFIEVDGERHYALPNHDVFVKRGEKVEAGQKLSAGALKPSEYLEATHDPMKTQQAIVNELQETFQKGGFKRLHRKTFELFARAAGNFGTVTDPGDSKYVHGDTVKLTEVNSLNKDLKNPIHIEPHVYGIEQAPAKSRDWIARLGFTRLKDVFEPMASTGGESNVVTGVHPLPKYVYGQHFGEIGGPKRGK